MKTNYEDLPIPIMPDNPNVIRIPTCEYFQDIINWCKQYQVYGKYNCSPSQRLLIAMYQLNQAREWTKGYNGNIADLTCYFSNFAACSIHIMWILSILDKSPVLDCMELFPLSDRVEKHQWDNWLLGKFVPIYDHENNKTLWTEMFFQFASAAQQIIYYDTGTERSLRRFDSNKLANNLFVILHLAICAIPPHYRERYLYQELKEISSL